MFKHDIWYLHIYNEFKFVCRIFVIWWENIKLWNVNHSSEKFPESISSIFAYINCKFWMDSFFELAQCKRKIIKIYPICPGINMTMNVYLRIKMV